MLRPLALLSLVFTACAAPKAPLQPLALRDAFAVVYRGGAAIADYSAPAADEAASEPPADPAKLPTVDLRAAILELEAADARALLASLPASASASAPQTQPQAADSARIQPTGPAMELAGLRGAHLDPALVDATIEGLRGRADSLMAPRLAVTLGQVATVSVQEQRAVVRSLDFLATEDVVLANPRVDRIDYGDSLRIRATEGKSGKQLAVTWNTTRLVTPVSVTTTPAGSIQAPALVRHELSATTDIQSNDALVLASVPGSEPGRVCLLLLVVEVGNWPRAGS